MAIFPIIAIVLSAQVVTLNLPGVIVLPHVGVLHTIKQLHGARLDALQRVATPWCFPSMTTMRCYQAMLQQCMARAQVKQGVPLAYTDEMQR